VSRRDENRGRRVRLLRTTDPHTTLRPGAEGVVLHTDDLGTVHVKWDNGSTLGIVPGGDDEFEFIPEQESLSTFKLDNGRCPDCGQWPEKRGHERGTGDPCSHPCHDEVGS